MQTVIDSELTYPRTTFNLHTAHALVRVAELVYSDEATIERTATREWGFSRSCFLDVDETQCVVMSNSSSVIVGFRGTEPDQIEDWMVDIDFDLIDGPLDGQVHAGFYDALSNVWRWLDDEVARMCADGAKELWVTGHSMGAALGALAVARWLEQDRPVAGFYAFGQPRTGDRQFALNFDFLFKPYTFRVVNHQDIVTRTPPRASGYRHLGSLRYFTESGELVDDISWWRWFLAGTSGSIESILQWGGGGVQDHGMQEYRQLIEQSLAAEAPHAANACPLRVTFSNPGIIPDPQTLVRPRRRVA